MHIFSSSQQFFAIHIMIYEQFGIESYRNQGKWIHLQVEFLSKRLLLRRTGEARADQQLAGLAGNRRQRAVDPGPEHARRLAIAYRLRAGRAQSAAHAPTRHRDRLRPVRRARRRVHNHRQYAGLEIDQAGRDLRVPQGIGPLPEEQREDAGGGGCGVQ